MNAKSAGSILGWIGVGDRATRPPVRVSPGLRLCVTAVTCLRARGRYLGVVTPLSPRTCVGVMHSRVARRLQHG